MSGENIVPEVGNFLNELLQYLDFTAKKINHQELYPELPNENAAG